MALFKYALARVHMNNLYPYLPEVEDLTMHLADVANVPVVPHCLVQLASGELAYITRRIDRIRNGVLHMEDMCQLTDRLTEDKYKGSYEQVAKAIITYSHQPGLDLVAPAYDLVNTSILMPTDTEELALPLDGHKSKLQRKHFENGFTTMGLTAKQQEGILEKFSDLLSLWTEMVSASFLPQEYKGAYTAVFNSRYSALYPHT